MVTTNEGISGFVLGDVELKYRTLFNMSVVQEKLRKILGCDERQEFTKMVISGMELWRTEVLLHKII